VIAARTRMRPGKAMVILEILPLVAKRVRHEKPCHQQKGVSTGDLEGKKLKTGGEYEGQDEGHLLGVTKKEKSTPVRVSGCPTQGYPGWELRSDPRLRYYQLLEDNLLRSSLPSTVLRPLNWNTQSTTKSNRGNLRNNRKWRGKKN